MNSSSPEYELIDCGDCERLERFGSLYVNRPAPQAEWPKSLDESVWSRAQLVYSRSSAPGKAKPAGKWAGEENISDGWHINFPPITMLLRSTPAGQVGVFPEQLPNWLWLREVLQKANRPARVLNCFGYTGASTLFAASAGSEENAVEVCHVDAAKSSVENARRNAEASGLKDAPIRWIVDDAMTFMQREERRGNFYDGIILDPPAFGRGPKSGRWILSRDLDKLLSQAKKIMSKTPLFFLLTCHDPAFTALSLERILRGLKLPMPNIESFDLTISASKGGNDLPCGIAARASIS